jgi:hypothetical protein
VDVDDEMDMDDDVELDEDETGVEVVELVDVDWERMLLQNESSADSS